MHRPSLNLITLLTSAAVVSVGGEAYAQAGPAAAFEEILVTAQRREERMQDVPIAIVAATGETLRRQGLTSTVDLQQLVPGLLITKAATGVQPYMRGVGAGSTLPGSDPSIPLYIDGVYISVPSALIFSFNNIERIETLKGPQGTLFGRNATGGLIQIVTRDPGAGYDAQVSAGYGNYDTVTTSTYLSAGNERIAGGVSIFYQNQGEGWGDNIFDPTGAPPLFVNGEQVPYPPVRSEVGESEEFGLQAKVVMHSADERTTAKLSYIHTKVNSNQYQYRRPLEGTVGTNGAQGGARRGFLFTGGFYDYNSDVVPENRPRVDLFSVEVSHDVGFVSVKSITSYLDALNRASSPSDFSPLAAGNRTETVMANRAFTQELQLLSNEGEGPEWLSWILGAYYLNGDAGFKPLRFFTGNYIEINRDVFANQNSESKAIYAQADFDITPTTTFTAGIRYNSDKVTATQYVIGRQTSTTPPPAAINVNGAISGTVEDQSETFNKATWHFALSQKISQDLMVYVSQSRGYKSGGYAVGSLCLGAAPVGQACPAPAAPYRPEILDAYEGGMKAEFLERRLRVNLAGYYYDYKDLQVGGLIVLPSGALVPIQNNAASSRVYGLETEVQAQVTPNLRVNASVALMDAKFKSYPGAFGFTPLDLASGGGSSSFLFDAAGNDLLKAPDFTSAVGAYWTIPTSVGPVELSGNWSHTGAFYWDPQNRVKQKSYDIVNAQVSISPTDHWALRLWGKNLTKAKYYVNEQTSTFGDQGSPGAPRTFGFAIDWRL